MQRPAHCTSYMTDVEAWLRIVHVFGGIVTLSAPATFMSCLLRLAVPVMSAEPAVPVVTAEPAVPVMPAKPAVPLCLLSLLCLPCLLSLLCLLRLLSLPAVPAMPVMPALLSCQQQSSANGVQAGPIAHQSLS